MNGSHSTLACSLTLALLAAVCVAQEPGAAAPGAEQAAMMAAWQQAMTPGEEHAELARGTGAWKLTARTWMDPSAEPLVSEGTSERRMILGGRVLEETFTSTMMGMPFEGRGRMGYDNVTGSYWSSWIDSMSTGVFFTQGSRDAATGVLTLRGEFQDPTTGDMVRVRAVVGWENDDTQQLEWYEDRGAGEVKTMAVTYERVDSRAEAAVP